MTIIYIVNCDDDSLYIDEQIFNSERDARAAIAKCMIRTGVKDGYCITSAMIKPKYLESANVCCTDLGIDSDDIDSDGDSDWDIESDEVEIYERRLNWRDLTAYG